MQKIASSVFWLSALALVAASSTARADCNVKDFIVKNIVSLQQSGSTQLAFVLTATQSEYEAAKKNFDYGADVYGLFSGNLNYGEAKQKATQIATATKFDYSSSYAENYLSQTVSGPALDNYVQCLELNKESPGLRLWLKKADGKYFTIRGFWVGANTETPKAKYDSRPIIDGGELIGLPSNWKKGKTEEFVVKSSGKEGFYLSLNVGGESKVLVVVPNPPDVIWNRQVVTSTKRLTAASSQTNPCTPGSDSDTINPLHPGGYFVANTRTLNHSTTDPGDYTETFTVDRPDQISVTMTQHTPACERPQSASGQLQAVETFPETAH